MKVFKITSTNVAFDEDESMVIVAESEESAKKMALKNWSLRPGRKLVEDNFVVEVVDLDKEKIIDVSHYGD